jgi:nitroreductase
MWEERRRLRRRVPTALPTVARLGRRRGLSIAANSAKVAKLSEAASVYPAVQNLLLTARALGLGATITTWHLALEGEFKRALGIPRHVKTFAVIPVGWPLGKFGSVRRRPAASVIHWNQW